MSANVHPTISILIARLQDFTYYYKSHVYIYIYDEKQERYVFSHG